MKKIITATLAFLVLASASLAEYGGNSAVATNSTWGQIVGSMGDQSDLNTVQTNVEQRLATEEIATTNEAALRAAVNVTATNALVIATNGLAIANTATATGTNALTIATNALAVARTYIASLTAVAVPDDNHSTNVVTVTAKNQAGSTFTQPYAFRVWIADTPYGALAAVAGEFAVTTGMELQQVVDKADYWIYATNIVGTAVFRVEDTGDGHTNYLHTCGPDGIVTVTPMAFDVQ